MKKSLVWGICRKVILVIVLLIVISMVEGAFNIESIHEKIPYELIIAIVIMIMLETIISYNNINKLYNQTNSAYNDISIYEKLAKKLIKQANEVVEKSINFEKEVQITVSKERTKYNDKHFNNKTNKRNNHNNKYFAKNYDISTMADLKSVVENYPNLKSNEAIKDLLEKIRVCENNLSSQKLYYNSLVENYNTIITNLPTNLIAKMGRFKVKEYYNDENEDS